ncbi:MAG: FKBP-type peptidyl-prolyl cis-trans isomerase, partial [Janthinobacterium lividum]
KPGGRIKLFVPSALGYGSTVTGSIPANSVLIFTIDLFSVQG